MEHASHLKDVNFIHAETLCTSTRFCHLESSRKTSLIPLEEEILCRFWGGINSKVSSQFLPYQFTKA